ncbi:glycosyltransferase [Nocardioides sp. MAH-18]|uniref:Glycosyltransferase n=1 Tax=Nocardioides agri TaxID=2682843 RepID=A0A6L6XQX8_9ACTN|nr:glycosyltransferase [Nocardioides sp. CGMCC 1.13656]MBA2954517.1 glycosyltransferase [Nocardioides sp. CGMCC 1.13656]MVQ49378.1 glycosyltransferase [Nocardioides sp. MAH-18]
MSAGDLLLRSGLLDVEFYAAQAGRTFADPAEAADHAVAVGMPERLTPNPFLDFLAMPVPVRRAWRAGRVGAVLDHLAGDDGRARRIGQLFDPRVHRPSDPAAVPLLDFLAHASDDAALPVPDDHRGPAPTRAAAREALLAAARVVATAGRSAPDGGPRVPGRTTVVIPGAQDWRAAQRAVRSVWDSTGEPTGDLAERGLEVVVVDQGSRAPAAHALASALVGMARLVRLPEAGDRAAGVAAGLEAATGDVVLLLDHQTRLRRGWLGPLRAVLADPEVAGVAPLVLGPDDTIESAGPDGLLAGHPKEDALELAGRTWRAVGEVAVAVRADSPRGAGGFRLAPTALVSHYPPDDAPSPRPVAAPVPDARPRWGVRLPSTPGIWGDDWGDTHFGESLAAALRRLGPHVVTHRAGAHDTPVALSDEVSLAIRGLTPTAPVPGAVNVLWVISHPEKVTPEEVAAYDLVFAASEVWAREATTRLGREVLPLLQATDVDERSWSEGPRLPEAVFVGGASRHRPMVELALEAGIPLAVHGHGWDHLPPGTWRSHHVPNDRLPELYGRHCLVVADHWTAMAQQGFVANRVFDAVAAGALVASDPVAGIEEHFGAAVAVCRTADDLRAAYDAARDADPGPRLAVARRVIAEDSFRARAVAFVEHVERFVPPAVG